MDYRDVPSAPARTPPSSSGEYRICAFRSNQAGIDNALFEANVKYL